MKPDCEPIIPAYWVIGRPLACAMLEFLEKTKEAQMKPLTESLDELVAAFIEFYESHQVAVISMNSDYAMYTSEAINTEATEELENHIERLKRKLNKVPWDVE